MKKISTLKLALVSSGRHAYEIAREAGMSETRLSRIANGRTEPSLDEVQRIADVLGLDSTDFRSVVCS